MYFTIWFTGLPEVVSQPATAITILTLLLLGEQEHCEIQEGVVLGLQVQVQQPQGLPEVIPHPQPPTFQSQPTEPSDAPVIWEILCI